MTGQSACAKTTGHPRQKNRITNRHTGTLLRTEVADFKVCDFKSGLRCSRRNCLSKYMGNYQNLYELPYRFASVGLRRPS